MFVAGAYLTITGGGGAVSGVSPDVALPWDLRFGIADGADQVRQRVRDIAQHGVDVIKVLATGAFLTHGSDPHAVEYTYDEMRAAVEEAAHKGLKVAAHAHSADGIKIAVRAGVASIEHGTYLDDEGHPHHEGEGHLPRRRHLRRRVDPAGRDDRIPGGLRRRSSPRATRSSARPSARPRRRA